MKFFMVLLIVVGTTVAASEMFRGAPHLDIHWKNYKSKYRKKYGNPVRESTRRKNWEGARARIMKHNEEASSGMHPYTMDENHLSDWHEEEKSKLFGYIPPGNETLSIAVKHQFQTRALPDSVDSRTSQCMPPISNQGQCSNCWAFTASANLGFALCSRKTGSPVRLSEQQLMDCASSTGCNGCNPCSTVNAWLYVKNAPGQAPLSVYPYTGFNGTCKYKQSMSAGNLTGYAMIAKRDELVIRTAVATYGAVSSAMHVVNSLFSYSSGIYSDPTCSTDGITANHAVMIVGYGSQNGVNYWILRNSWGTLWGQQGYFLMKRGENACNIESNVVYLVV